MAGEMGGVGALLKKDNPFCIFVHCVSHRLNLAVLQACKNNQHMATLQEILRGIYNYVNGSANRLQQFEDIASLLKVNSLKFKKIFDIRWLSMGACVLAVVRNYKALSVHLSQDAALGNPVAIGLFQQMRKYKFVALMYLSADILAATNHLSKLFQHRDITFSAVRSSVEDCMSILQGFLTTDGTFLGKFHKELSEDPIGTFQGIEIDERAERGHQAQGEEIGQRASFHQTKTDLINNLLENLKQRFPQVLLLDAMQVFDPKAYPADIADVDSWGCNHLDTLLKHFGEEKTNVDGIQFVRMIDPVRCRGEFLTFKRRLHRNRGVNKVDEDGNQRFHFYRPTELFGVVFGGPHGEDNKVMFVSMYNLMAFCIFVMVGNAEAERIFSIQNRIKTHLRMNLTIERLDQLIRLSNTEGTIESFDFDTALHSFMSSAKRRI